MADISAQTDVSRPSALPSANLGPRPTLGPSSLQELDSAAFLDSVEEDWNKRVDAEIETLVDGMVDLVGLASVSISSVASPVTQ